MLDEIAHSVVKLDDAVSLMVAWSGRLDVGARG